MIILPILCIPVEKNKAMNWFEKIKPPLIRFRSQKTKIPEGLWVKCDKCKEIIFKNELDKNLKVCPKQDCNFHYRLTAKERIDLLVEKFSFEEFDQNLVTSDPLQFRDSKKYKDRLKTYQKKTGQKDAIISGTGKLNKHTIQICAFDFFFMGGSMGSVIGEKITRAINRAIARRQPLLIVSCSGGARMQEGILSLMQMAKTSAALSRLAKHRLPYISILADPTTGGVTASIAMLGDVILTEPEALIGFAGPRVIEQTIRQKLPAGFQRSEFLLEHGFIDKVVHRKHLKKTISDLLDCFMPPKRLVKNL